jgi:predicted membrane chloride channel (bestrophin family)
MDNTYKNEPNYEIKKTKLQRLSEKLKNISQLITESERVIDTDQPVFFSMAMDVRMKNVVNDVRLQLNESYHNLLEIERQIIQYLNMIDYQNRIFEKPEENNKNIESQATVKPTEENVTTPVVQ